MEGSSVKLMFAASLPSVLDYLLIISRVQAPRLRRLKAQLRALEGLVAHAYLGRDRLFTYAFCFLCVHIVPCRLGDWLQESLPPAGLEP